MLSPVVLAALGAAPQGSPVADPRQRYDVSAYRLELAVDPRSKRIDGWGWIEARVVADELAEVRLDLHAQLEVSEVRLSAAPVETAAAGDGVALGFAREDSSLAARLPEPLARGATFALAIRYGGQPISRGGYHGFLWERTPSGEPWIGTSMQQLGAHHWFPCKDSFWRPEDKPERVRVAATVPRGLVAVSNGRLVERAAAGEDRERFAWQHDYPVPTYSITLNVAPYVAVEGTLELRGHAEPVPFTYWVLPEDRAKAEVQFRDVAPMLDAFARAFGPFPFPRSKVGIVQTKFWGMEHSTAIAYGNSFPAWCAASGAPDPYAARNKQFDLILVHQTAHEWWGNSVTAADWQDFWIHEGFGTYAESVYVELVQGVDEAADYWRRSRPTVSRKGSLDRGRGSSSGQAYSGILYSKGAWTLHTLRTFVADDDAWWRTLRAFHEEHRHGSAKTADFRRVLERETGRDWGRFFDEWFRGSGFPKVEGVVAAGERGFTIAATCEGTDGTPFHVPLDLAWSEGGEPVERRFELAPGRTELTVETAARPEGLRLTSLERILGELDVRIVEKR